MTLKLAVACFRTTVISSKKKKKVRILRRFSVMCHNIRNQQIMSINN
uniref:Uncharacterized protein n=1 Tax=Arundo donax TaxID=35708 RepID=A0A0A9G359_ARUDO